MRHTFLTKMCCKAAGSTVASCDCGQQVRPGTISSCEHLTYNFCSLVTAEVNRDFAAPPDVTYAHCSV